MELDIEESFLSNRDYSVEHVGPEIPDKIGYIGWRQITKTESSNHRELENDLHCLRCHTRKLMGGWKNGLKGQENWRQGYSIGRWQLSYPKSSIVALVLGRSSEKGKGRRGRE